MSEDIKDKSPFQRGWASPKWRKTRDKYTKIIIPEINIKYNVNEGWWSKQTSKNKKKRHKDKKEVATYFREKLIELYKNDPNKRLQVVEDSSANTVILELAIVELVPTKVILNLLPEVVKNLPESLCSSLAAQSLPSCHSLYLIQYKDVPLNIV